MPKTVKAWALQYRFQRHGKLRWGHWCVARNKTLAHLKLRSSIWIIDQARAADVTSCKVKKKKDGELEGTFATPGADWDFRIYEIDAEDN